MKTRFLVLFAIASLLFSCYDDDYPIYTEYINEDPGLSLTEARLSRDGDVIEITSSKDVSINYILAENMELISDQQVVVSDKYHNHIRNYGWFSVTTHRNTITGRDYKITIEVQPNHTDQERRVPIYCLYCWTRSPGHPYTLFGPEVQVSFIQEK